MPEFKPIDQKGFVQVYPFDRRLNVKEDVYSHDGRYQLVLLDKNGKFLDATDEEKGVRPSKKVFPHLKKKLFSNESDCQVCFLYRHVNFRIAPKTLKVMDGSSVQVFSTTSVFAKIDCPKFFAYLASKGKKASVENEGVLFSIEEAKALFDELANPVLDAYVCDFGFVKRHKNLNGQFSIDSAWTYAKDGFKEAILSPIRGKLAEMGIIV